ncbi:MAG: hypothetical protein WBK40_01165, partial [Bacteroidales bacterium]
WKKFEIKNLQSSRFFFVCWFVGRFCRALEQTHSLPSLGLSVGVIMASLWRYWRYYGVIVPVK